MRVRKLSRTIIVLIISFMALFSIISLTTLPALAESGVGISTEYAIPSDSVVLAKGATGEDVKWLQSALNTVMNVNLTVDGNFGGNTETVLMEFQKSKGIDANGKADSATINALAEAAGQRTTTVTTQTVTNSTTSDENEESGHAFKDYWKTYFENAHDLIFHFKDKHADIKDYLGGFASALVMCLPIGIACIIILWLFSYVPYEKYNGSGIYERDPIDGVSYIAKLIFGIAILIFLIPCFVDMYYINSNFSISVFKLIGIEFLYLILRLLIGAGVALLAALALGIIISVIAFLIINLGKGIKKIISKGDTVFSSPVDLFEAIALSKPGIILGIIIAVIVILFYYIIPIFMQFS